MTALLERPTVDPVGDDAREGSALRTRRQTLGLSLRQLSELTGINRDTLGRVEAGNARGTSVQAVRAALDRLEREMGVDMPAAEDAPDSSDLLEFEVEGAGFRVVVKGPIKDSQALQETVLSLIEGLRGDQEPSSE